MINWSRKHLTNDELEKELQKLGADIEIKELFLSSNQLTFAPALTKYSQFRKLKNLWMHVNHIETVNFNSIPHSCELLDISGNKVSVLPDLCSLICLREIFLSDNNMKHLNGSYLPLTITRLCVGNNSLTEFPNLSHLRNLKEVDVHGNSISHVIRTHLPPSVTHLKLNHNKLTALPNLPHLSNLTELDVHKNSIREISDLSHFSTLKRLYVRFNPLSTITGLPERLDVLSMDRKGVLTLGEKCFSKTNYRKLKTGRGMMSLVEPPVQIFKNGLPALRTYFEQQRSQQSM